MRVALLSYLLVFAFPAWAHRAVDGDIYAALGAFTYQTQTRSYNPVYLSGALTVEADVYDKGGLEIGFMYLHNAYSVHQGELVYAEAVKRLYITTGYRHWFTPQFSAAIAFASSYAMGDPYVARDDFGTLDHPGTSARDITEYGVDFSGQYEFFQSGRWSLLADLRYGWDVTPKKGEDANHYGALVLLKYFVQSREKIE